MIALDGCRSEPLGSYLQGLGAWHALVRIADPDARASWHGGRMVLTTSLGDEDVISALVERYEPLPIVSPWNAGSGFAGTGKNVEAEHALATVRASGDPRFGPLRAAVLAADDIVVTARNAGWAGKGSTFWDAARKPDVLRLCRNRLPDAAVSWLDAVAALSQDAEGENKLTYNRLLGTGANFGRQDLQNTYLRHCLKLLTDQQGIRSSPGWLRAVLYGDETTPYLREAVGQFDPGRAGGIQSSPAEKADDAGFANPWSFLLTVEGALLFASTATRRQGAATSDAAIPFVVRASTVGYGSSAVDEGAQAEIWTPEWDRPATLAEIEHLLGEGRARWRDRPASNGLEFAQAVATLGVDRGVRRFVRSVFAPRLGQNPLAVPVGVVEVTERGGAGLLAEVDEWLSRLRGTALPSTVRTRLRVVEESMYALAASGEADGMRRVLIDLGLLHEAVGRSGKTAEQVRLPLTIRNGHSWWHLVQPHEPNEPGAAELRLAAALAAGRDRGLDGKPMRWGALRQLVTPVADTGYLAWRDRPRASMAAGALAAVAAAHRLRSVPGAVRDPQEFLDVESRTEPATRGVFSAFALGPTASLIDVVRLIEMPSGGSDFDDELFTDYLRGLMLVDWSRVEKAPFEDVPRVRKSDLVPPALAALVAFYGRRPFNLQLDEDDPAETRVLLRPDSSWLPRIHAGDIGGVVSDAIDHLHVAGLRDTIHAGVIATNVDQDRLAAALLVPVRHSHRLEALKRIAALPSTPDTQGAAA